MRERELDEDDLLRLMQEEETYRGPVLSAEEAAVVQRKWAARLAKDIFDTCQERERLTMDGPSHG